MKRIIALVAGVMGVSIGGLWLFQGLGLVRIRPILCFADCAPIQGPSSLWAIMGFVMAAAGGIAIYYSRIRRELP